MFFFKKFKNQNNNLVDVGSVFDYILVGLGNPGLKYLNTRHNIGYMAVEIFAEKFGSPGKHFSKLKFKSVIEDVRLSNHRVLVIKPETYMNLSGEAVSLAMEFYKIPLQKVIVIYDDISMPLGKIRIRQKGSDGGHNGIKNIIYLQGTDVFPRIKVGIGSKPEGSNLSDYVLSRFTKEEGKILLPSLEVSANAAKDIIEEGITAAMNRYN